MSNLISYVIRFRIQAISALLGIALSFSVIYATYASVNKVTNREINELVTLVPLFDFYDMNYFRQFTSFNQTWNVAATTGKTVQVQRPSSSFRVDIIADPSMPELKHVGVNNHYVGRIAIPALSVEDAVYYTGDNFYLRRNREGNNHNAGELYIDGRSPGNLSKLDNLINGHSMRNGSKFGRLLKIYKYKEPLRIYFADYRSGTTYIYQVFSANLVSNADSGIYLNFSSNYERNLYYEKLKESSTIPSNVTDFSNSILTLNTCDTSIKDGHLIVSAVLIGWR